jgi:hypothetical protein
MKTVHEFFTNKRMEDSRFENSWFYSWMVPFARVESLRGRMGASRSTRHPGKKRRGRCEGAV